VDQCLLIRVNFAEQVDRVGLEMAQRHLKVYVPHVVSDNRQSEDRLFGHKVRRIEGRVVLFELGKDVSYNAIFVEYEIHRGYVVVFDVNFVVGF